MLHVASPTGSWFGPAPVAGMEIGLHGWALEYARDTRRGRRERDRRQARGLRLRRPRPRAV